MIYIKTQSEIETMREAGAILKQVIDSLVQSVRPGITTKDLDVVARDLLVRHNVKPAFLGYNGFPATLCTSVNEEVVHGVPSSRILKQGDIISLDMGLVYKDFYSDSAVTIPVLGEMSHEAWVQSDPKADKLINVTRQALYAGIDQAVIGNRVGAIGNTIQRIVEAAGFHVVVDLVGHGVGHRLHEEPQIPNWGKLTDGPILKEGMVIAIEPIVVMGKRDVVIGDDGSTYITRDKSRAAHFEHTIAITPQGPVILTD